MSDQLQVVTFSRGGRPIVLFDLERVVSDVAGDVYREKDTFKVTPPEAQNVDTVLPGRFGGSQTVAQRHNNGQISARWTVKGSTAQAALDNAEAFAVEMRKPLPGRYVRWKPDGVSYATYFPLRGPGTWTVDYSVVRFQQNYSMSVEASWPVAPLAEMDRMDIFDDFSVPADAALVRTNPVPNPRFALDTALWSTSVPAFHINPGSVITRSAAGGPTGIGIPSADPPYAQFAMDNATQNFEGGSIPVAPPDGVAFRSGQPYTFSIYLHSLGGAGGSIQLFVGSPSANSNSTTLTVTNGWVRYTLTWTPTADVPAGNCYFTVRNSAGVGAARTIGVTAAQVDTGSAALAYVDGDFDKACWSGAPHASTSKLYDRSTLSDWTVDLGALRVADGSLRPVSGADIRARHTARGHRYTDVQITARCRIGTTLSGAIDLVVKRKGTNDFVYAYWLASGAADFNVVTSNTFATPAGASGTGSVPAWSANLLVWYRLRIEGNVLTAEWFTAAPGPMTAPVASRTATLSVADAANFGQAVAADTGIRFENVSNDLAIEEVTVEPFTYRNRLFPDVVSLGGQIPGTAPARLDLELTTSGGTAPAWAMLAWWQRPGLFNRIWNGDFEGDTNAVLPRGWRTGALEVNNAPTSFLTVSTQAKYGTKSGEVVTPATTASGPEFKVYGPFKKGVTYTARAWMRSTAQVTPVNLTIWGPVGPESASSTALALSPTWTEHVATWTPVADHSYAVLAPRTTAATATTFQVDGVHVYEGTAPTLASQQEGRGAMAPLGIVEAEACDTGDLVGWAITADANYRVGNGLKVTTSGAGSAAAMWFVDPALVVPDDFTMGEIDVDVFARVELAATVVSPKLVLSTRPSSGIAYGAERFSNLEGSSGKLLTTPSSGTAFRPVKVGTLTFVVDTDNPVRWKLRLAASWAGGSSGQFGLDQLLLVPTAARAFSGPTGKANDTSYPKFVTTTNETTRLLRSDGSGATRKPTEGLSPDVGMSRSLELPPGNAQALLMLSTLVPDDPTLASSSETKDYTATAHFSVVPRMHLVRGS